MVLLLVMAPLIVAALLASWNDRYIQRYSQTLEEFRERRKWVWAGFLFAMLSALLSALAISAGHTVAGYMLQGIAWLLFPVKIFINKTSTGGLGPFANDPSLPRLILDWVGRLVRRPFRPY